MGLFRPNPFFFISGHSRRFFCEMENLKSGLGSWEISHTLRDMTWRMASLRLELIESETLLLSMISSDDSACCGVAVLQFGALSVLIRILADACTMLGSKSLLIL